MYCASRAARAAVRSTTHTFYATDVVGLVMAARVNTNRPMPSGIEGGITGHSFHLTRQSHQRAQLPLRELTGTNDLLATISMKLAKISLAANLQAGQRDVAIATVARRLSITKTCFSHF
jgi:hypothetical protein